MPLRVLIVEDEFLLAHTMRQQLESYGHQVIGIATTGERAVETCRRELPDVTLMDIRMPPGMDGITATRQLMEDCPHPVAIVTGNPGHEDEAEAAGAMAYITKPLITKQIPAFLELVQARFREFLAVHQQSATHHETLAAWHLVQRAVRAVMAREGLSETDAFARLQQTAARQQVTLAAVAREILGG